MEGEHDDQLSFVSLAAVTANVVAFLIKRELSATAAVPEGANAAVAVPLGLASAKLNGESAVMCSPEVQGAASSE